MNHKLQQLLYVRSFLKAKDFCKNNLNNGYHFCGAQIAVSMKTSKPKPINAGKLFRNTILASLLILVTSITLFHEPILIYYGQWLAPSNPQPTGDVVISLGDKNRIETAVSLLASGQVKALYADVIDPKQLQEIVTKNGLSPSKIYWGGKPKNTFDEALAFHRTMNSANFPYHRVVIVSDRYHLRRSQWAFRYRNHNICYSCKRSNV